MVHYQQCGDHYLLLGLTNVHTLTNPSFIKYTENDHAIPYTTNASTVIIYNPDHAPKVACFIYQCTFSQIWSKNSLLLLLLIYDS